MPSETIGKRRVLTVEELTQDIKTVLENSLPDVWVVGEVSNLSRPASGHIYFTLKDSHSQIRTVFFRDYNRSPKFQLKDGMQILCFGSVRVYERGGNYQLCARCVEPKGLGSLELAFQQLKQKLAREGFFDQARKRSIPPLPKRIAIITSSSGAVIHDMLTVLKRRAMLIQATLFPVRVQGEGAAGEIAQAVKLANKHANFDCLLLARGGGSLEDLWAFNEEVLARAVFSSRIPVVSAVGHEVDWTIADFVADLRAPTPSAAIELIIPSRDNLQDRLKELIIRLEQYMHRLIPDYQQRLDDLLVSLGRSLNQMVELKTAKARGFLDRFKALSPLDVLRRGYSITFNKRNHKVIRDIKDVMVGTELVTILSRGKLESVLKNKSNRG
ncbi:MAG: exodeoxyribonuclease VII large subunit [Candidatus Omnitrophica bacterium]|nr:exodeoxyribonuclease VII large subunit [Candidatus Omnitrophota bacterium]